MYMYMYICTPQNLHTLYMYYMWSEIVHNPPTIPTSANSPQTTHISYRYMYIVTYTCPPNQPPPSLPPVLSRPVHLKGVTSTLQDKNAGSEMPACTHQINMYITKPFKLCITIHSIDSYSKILPHLQCTTFKMDSYMYFL